jgi:hypothetical protein
MHAVSLTPHAQKIFRTTSKSENHMQKSDGMQNMTPKSTNDSNGPGTINERFEQTWQPLKEISIKRYMFSNCPTPPVKKINKFKGAT